MGKLTIDGLEIEVRKKKIKNMYLSVLPLGRVCISAPYSMSEETIRKFINTKLTWIRKKQQNLIKQPLRSELKFVTGESVMLWGQELRLEALESNSRRGIQIRDNAVIMPVKADSTSEQRKKRLNNWYRKQLKAVIPYLLEKWQKNIGVCAAEWNVKDMKTRWGSCNIKKKRIWLNLQLAKKPVHCLEYVIVHELVHLLERSHSRAFKAYMDRFLPDWRKTREELMLL